MIDKIICLGKNYPSHAAELGDSQPEQPVMFLKPSSTLLPLSDEAASPFVDVTLPFRDVHHELEIVFQLAADSSHTWFSAFTLGLDLTRRELQNRLKKDGHPWEIAKVFKHSAILGPWQKAIDWPHFREQAFELWVNGELRQSAVSSEMLWSPERCLKLAKAHFPILMGDLMFTGTPVGVGPLKHNDRVQMRWATQKIGPELRIQIAENTN